MRDMYKSKCNEVSVQAYPMVQAAELSSQRIELSAEELREAAEKERARLERMGEIDRVGDRLGVGADAAPKFDSLVGKTIEVRWRYWTQEGNKRKQVRACSLYGPSLPLPC